MSSGGSTGSYNNNAHLLASNNQRRRYPVVDLNDETSFRYLTTMEGLLADALASDLRKSSVHRCFDVIRETDEWSIHHRVLAPRRHEYVCFGRHTTTLASLQDAMYTSDSFAFRSVCALLYPAHIEDAALLQVMHTADRGHFFGVKFVALNAPSVTDEIASTKEFLYAEVR
ncbi:hypothetical protein DYB30_008464 [Aphanomyces astaci]|uniref:Uncharacterized protein n=1 Tax=Aphanomyces astaci TaxID=112090 RepID=A0A397CB99_APHAT|nr:hypothetical protein DYB30_008464 [Aphanomyces astaci]